MKIPQRLRVVTVLLFNVLLFTSPLIAAELTIKNKDTAGKTSYDLILENIEKLAGMKISLEYKEAQMKYTAATKSTNLNSFLHVVNDKTPGKLVVVMASAKGISASEQLILTLQFEKNNKTSSHPAITIKHCELMSEDLKEIKCNYTPKK